MPDGILIVFEGIDGVGKTTQVELLRSALMDAGEVVTASKEPTDGPWGRKVRESAKTGRLSLEDELEAFTEDRKEHVANLIRPALERGEIVLLDRYFFSTIAYQGARGADVAELTRQMLAIAPMPDVVFLIDVDPNVALSRIQNSRFETPNQFERVEPLMQSRAIFKGLAAEFPSVVKEINGHYPREMVYEQIARHLLEGVVKAKRCYKEYGCEGIHCVPRNLGECRWAELNRSLLTRGLEIASK